MSVEKPKQFEVDTARHVGNVSQAFSHLALVEAAVRTIVPDGVRRRG